jgi:hypothetical protein
MADRMWVTSCIDGTMRLATPGGTSWARFLSPANPLKTLPASTGRKIVPGAEILFSRHPTR